MAETESSTARQREGELQQQVIPAECNKDKTFNVLIVSLQLIGVFWFFFFFKEKLFYVGIARLTVAAVDKNSS